MGRWRDDQLARGSACVTDADDATRPIGSPRTGLPPVPGAQRPATRTAPAPRGATARRPRGFFAALAWTVANTVVPGTGFLAAGRRRTGIAVLAAFLLLVGG